MPKPARISFEDFHSPVKLVRANGLYVPIKSVSGKVLKHLKGTLAKALQSLGIRGVECCIIIRKPSSRDEDFIRAGVKLVQTEEQAIRAAVIDLSLLWFGSIDLAGTHHREEDNAMRVLAPVIASEMLGYIM